MTWAQIAVAQRTYVMIHGKGRKERSVPLWSDTAQALRRWKREADPDHGSVVFPNARGQGLSRDGVGYILARAVETASEDCHSLQGKRVTPHLVRHTTAVHLLQSGVDIATIALWLGHESIETTHRYMEADLAAKERALAKVDPLQASQARYRADDALLSFLDDL